MESLESWIGSFCQGETVLVVKDGGRPALEIEGVYVISLDPERGFHVPFALETYHPVNVVAFDPDDETRDAVSGSMTVQRFWVVGSGESAIKGWTATTSPYGVLHSRNEAA